MVSGPSARDPAAVLGAPVRDADRRPLGTVEQVYVDPADGRARWVLLDGDLVGGRPALVPVEGARLAAGWLEVPFDARAIAGAPHHEPGRELSPADEDEVLAHYRRHARRPVPGGPATAHPGGDTGGGKPAGDAPADRDVEAGQTVVRSEERLRVGLERRETGRVRIRTTIRSETVTRTVEVRHDEVEVHREPIADGAPVLGGGPAGVVPAALSPQVLDLVLYAERAVAVTETVPVERIVVGTRTVVGTETVSAELRREQVDLDVSDGSG